MKFFETILILKPEVDLDKKLKELEQLFKTTTDHVYLKDMGEKHLAYPQRGYNDGHYLLIYYNSVSDWIRHELELHCRTDDDILKFLTTNVEDATDIDFDELKRIDLVSPNKRIDALDVILGFADYKRKENCYERIFNRLRTNDSRKS